MYFSMSFVLAAQVLQFQRDLLVDGRDPPGQQAAQPEDVPFPGGERRVLVEQRMPEDLRAARSRRHFVTGIEVHDGLPAHGTSASVC